MSTTSRLASLLVQSARVSSAQMAEAFQRQVIYGGLLDTVVLELGLVDESILIDYLGQSAGLPVLEDWPPGDPRQLQRVLPLTLAEKYKVAPVAASDGILMVAVTDPPDRMQLERLALLINMQLDAVVAPEYRFHLAMDRAYGIPPPSRFATLWAKLKTRHEAERAARRIVRGDEPTQLMSNSPVGVDAEASGRVRVPFAAGQSTGRQVTGAEALPQIDEDPDDVFLAIAATWTSVEVPVKADEPVKATREPEPTGPHPFFEAVESVQDQPTDVPEPIAGSDTTDEITLEAEPGSDFEEEPGPEIATESPRPAVVEDGDDEESVPSERTTVEPRETIEREVATATTEERSSAPSPIEAAPATEAEGTATVAAVAAATLPAVDSAAPELIAAASDTMSAVPAPIAEPTDITLRVAITPGVAAARALDEAVPESAEVDATIATASPVAVFLDPAAPELRARAESPSSAPTPTSPVSPLQMVEGLRLLEDASTRDQVFETLCRLARARFDHVILFSVHGDQCVARIALGTEWIDRSRLADVSVPIAQSPALHATVDGRSPYLGKLGADPALTDALARLDRPSPLWGALVPVILRGRTVAVLCADAAGRVLDGFRIAELAQATAEASQVLQRLILRAKSEALQEVGAGALASVAGVLSVASSPRSVPAVAYEAGERVRAGTLLGLGAAAPAPAGADFLLPSPVPYGVTPDLDGFIATIAAGGSDVPAAVDALFQAGETGARALAARLPGPLRLRRYALGAPLDPLSQYGPLLGLVPRWGRLIVPHLLLRLGELEPEVRFYVALCFAELPFPEAVPHLGGRLFDHDIGVRRAAVLALGRSRPSPELTAVIDSLRSELPALDPARQRMAIDALGELRDIPSVPRLIELVRHRDELLVTSVRRALLLITKQDFGTSRWRWRSWWEQHRTRSRVDWLLDGLLHHDLAARQSASDELEWIHTEQFGYHSPLPRAQREEARAKWAAWYKALR